MVKTPNNRFVGYLQGILLRDTEYIESNVKQAKGMRKRGNEYG